MYSGFSPKRREPFGSVVTSIHFVVVVVSRLGIPKRKMLQRDGRKGKIASY